MNPWKQNPDPFFSSKSQFLSSPVSADKDFKTSCQQPEGIVNSANFPTVRKIIELRMKRGKEPARKENVPHSRSPDYTVKQLQKDITKITKEKEAFVNETSLKENRLLSLLDGLCTLWRDKLTADLITSEGIRPVPKLKGTYNV